MTFLQAIENKLKQHFCSTWFVEQFCTFSFFASSRVLRQNHSQTQKKPFECSQKLQNTLIGTHAHKAQSFFSLDFSIRSCLCIRMSEINLTGSKKNHFPASQSLNQAQRQWLNSIWLTIRMARALTFEVEVDSFFYTFRKGRWKADNATILSSTLIGSIQAESLRTLMTISGTDWRRLAWNRLRRFRFRFRFRRRYLKQEAKDSVLFPFFFVPLPKDFGVPSLWGAW